MLQSVHVAGRLFVACQSSGRLNQLISGSTLTERVPVPMDDEFTMHQIEDSASATPIDGQGQFDADMSVVPPHNQLGHNLSELGVLGAVQSEAVMDDQLENVDQVTESMSVPSKFENRVSAQSRFSINSNFDSVENILDVAQRHRQPSLGLMSAASVSGDPLSHPRVQMALESAQLQMSQLKEQYESSQNEADKLRNEMETLRVEFEAKIDELNMVNDELNIETQQYQMRYQEINEQLLDLQASKQEATESGICYTTH